MRGAPCQAGGSPTQNPTFQLNASFSSGQFYSNAAKILAIFSALLVVTFWVTLGPVACSLTVPDGLGEVDTLIISDVITLAGRRELRERSFL